MKFLTWGIALVSILAPLLLLSLRDGRGRYPSNPVWIDDDQFGAT